MDVAEGFCWCCDGETPTPVKCTNCDMGVYCSQRCKGVDAMNHTTRECLMIMPRLCHFCQSNEKEAQMCSGCCAIWYCSKGCQRKHWKLEHKAKCEAHKLTTHQMANNLRMDYRRKTMLQRCLKDMSNDVGVETIALPFALDLLKLQENELTMENTTVNEYKVLTVTENFLANFLLSAFSLPDNFAEKVMFCQVEGNVSTLARDVLLLYLMITKEDFDKPISEVIPMLWFSLRLTTNVAKHLNAVLSKLAELDLETFTANIRGQIALKAEDFVKIRKIWKQWRDAACCIDSKECIPLYQERKKAFRKPGHLKGIEEYREFLPELHIPSVDQWFANGNFILSSEQTQVIMTHYNPLFIENTESASPTFSRATTKPQGTKFALRCDWLPFKVFDYITMKKNLATTPISAVELVYQFVAKMVLSVQKLFEEDSLKTEISLFGNKPNLSLKSFLGEVKFDRIFFSACVADGMGVSRLLDDNRDLVNPENPMATVIVELTRWYALSNDARGLGKEDTTHNEEDHHFATTKYSAYLPEPYVISLKSMVAEFLNFLRAEHIAYVEPKKGRTNPSPMDLPKVSELFAKNGTRYMRDFRRKKNKIVSFMYRVHQRPLNNLTGRNRFLEFTLSSDRFDGDS